MLLTIAIPSYNRPETLIRLLKSIDITNDDIDILICEDNSPRRLEIRSAVYFFIHNSQLNIDYHENEINLGYDENLWSLVKKSKGHYLLFMGDDDEFVPGALVKLKEFLYNHNDIGFILKSHYIIHENGDKEIFNYYSGNMLFDPGPKTIVELFRKSVLISGFCIRKDNLYDYYTSALNGTLLIQLFFLAIIAKKYKCAYFSQALIFQRVEGNVPFFGSSENERKFYSPGDITIENSINFMKSYIKILSYIDEVLKIDIKDKILLDLSKYFYPTLAIQRNRGRKDFYRYFLALNNLGFNVSIYYYIYFISLYVLGKRFCDSAIINLKRILKVTPKL